ncbi:MAG: biotin--[acetyl-CoA-carboxylase] ligase [Syntrophales bacterium]|nr:biotin--[acetyl-CoA-carboxylase] ligase [Syntrophales bacterium]
MTRKPAGRASTREIMLDLLKKSQEGGWVSGQLLAEVTAMTRSAVWKQIMVLREEGYRIEALTRRGYRLLDIPDKLLVSEIRDGLKTEVIGKKEIFHYKQTDSTNRRAKELAAANVAEGTLVIAEEQTQGRGRLDRQWFSPAGQGIYMSLIIRPSLFPAQATRMVLLTAVAVAEALIDTTGLDVMIKWPNDILVRGRKLAGILMEVAMEMDAIDYMVVGLGVNVNIGEDQFPEVFRGQATSILMETGRPFLRLQLLRRILESFEHHYRLFQEAGYDPIVQRFRALTDIVGRQISVQTINGSFSGEVMDFDPDGFLVLRDNKGDDIRIYSGDVTIR